MTHKDHTVRRTDNRSVAMGLDKMAVAEVVASLLADRGWTQRELAERSGLNERQISLYVRGESEPNMPTLAKIARAFGLEPSALRQRIRRTEAAMN